MKYRWLASAVVLLAVACAPGGKKEKGTAAPTSEKPPVIATLKAPVAAEDIVWEEWAPTGVAAAKLDWPSGAAWARGKLCLVGSRRVAAPAGKKGVFAETVFYEVTPGGGREVAAYTNTFGESAAAGVTADPLGHLWVVGGYYTPPPIKTVPEGELTYTALAGPVSEVRVWSPADKQFKLETILPIPRGDATTLFADNQIYVVGGVYDRADPENDNNKQIHRYDPRDGLWTKLHDLGFGLASPAAAVTGKQLYIFGGKRLKPQHITNAAFRYDLEVFKWQRLPSLPAPRAGAAAFVVGNHIYLLGGREAEGIGGIQRLALKGYRYDLNGRKWEELRSPLPEGSYFIVYDGASFYLVGNDKTYRGRIVKTRPAS